MEYQITGKVAEVYQVIRVNERFRKREFVIEHKESGAAASRMLILSSSSSHRINVRLLMSHGSVRMLP